MIREVGYFYDFRYAFVRIQEMYSLSLIFVFSPYCNHFRYHSRVAFCVL